MVKKQFRQVKFRSKFDDLVSEDVGQGEGGGAEGGRDLIG